MNRGHNAPQNTCCVVRALLDLGHTSFVLGRCRQIAGGPAAPWSCGNHSLFQDTVRFDLLIGCLDGRDCQLECAAGIID
jgi:hypothetical protein